MLDVISTSISTVGLLIQLYDRHGQAKVVEIAEYKQGLRDIVSSLHFAKSMHAVAHEVMDSQCTAIFDANLRNLGVQDFCDAYRANLGRIYEKHMKGEIGPSIAKYEALVSSSVEECPTAPFTNQFVISVGSLTQSYPRMIDAYKKLEKGIDDIDQEIEKVSMNVSDFYRFAEHYDSNREAWKSYINHHNRLLLTLADQTILSQITILDELFVV